MSPPIDVSQVSLFKATIEQDKISRKYSYEEWGRRSGLDFADYLRMDTELRQQPHAADGKLTTWVLAPRHDPVTLDFLCFCRTYERDALYCLSESTESQDGCMIAITTVVARPEYRGLGYGRHMMQLLHWVIASEQDLPSSSFPTEWGAPPMRPHQQLSKHVLSSFLYSDIGNEFYASCGPTLESRSQGWIVADATTAFLDVSNALDHLGKFDESDVIFLSREAASEIWDADAAHMRTDIETIANETLRFCILPNKGVAAYPILRSDISSTPPRLPYWGVKLGSPDKLRFATWTCDPIPLPGVERKLVLTRLRASEDDVEALLIAVCKFVYEQTPRIWKVEIWDAPTELHAVLKELGCTIENRTEHLSSVKFYGDLERMEYRWMFNEHYAWC